MKTGVLDWVGLLGRVLMSAIFIWAGYGKAMAPTVTMAGFAHVGLPLPGVAYALALAIEIGFGIMFLIGFRTRLAGLVLAGWCVATAMVAHYHPENHDAMIHFMKNICMAGGFLQVVAFGGGGLGVSRG
jgi:putative oxidoreductase